MQIRWEIILSFVTAITAIVALIQTQRQISISNKQSLFEKRIEAYLVGKGLLQLFKENQRSLSCKGKGPYMAIEVDFAWLTNNSFLESITDAIGTPLEMPGHRIYLMKMEEIKTVSTKIHFLFSGKEAYKLAEYVLSYQELLTQMYKYKILLVNMHKASEKFNWDFEYTLNKFDEAQQRSELQSALDKLQQTFTYIENRNVVDKIERQIKL